MSRYVVHFMKDVLGGNGRQIERCLGGTKARIDIA